MKQFHGILNRKWRRVLLEASCVTRVWVEDPIQQKRFLEAPFSCEKIKRAVLDSGSEKTVGPDDSWCSRIIGLLCSARDSILVTGSSTDEFIVQRGLRQGSSSGPSYEQDPSLETHYRQIPSKTYALEDEDLTDDGEDLPLLTFFHNPNAFVVSIIRALHDHCEMLRIDWGSLFSLKRAERLSTGRLFCLDLGLCYFSLEHVTMDIRFF
ncbi:RNA-directed DNA polymerase, eukaryota [Tanacetum coccineum]